MDTIKKTITAYVPGNACNLRCSYCYVTECFRKKHINYAHFNYHMIKAFSPKRIGGGKEELAHIVVIGGGETLMPPEVIPFVKGLLAQGHIVELVTNATLNERIEALLDLPTENLDRLIVKCSLHWNELKKLNKLEDYFNNMKKVLSAGASAYPFLAIGPEYMDSLEEIHDMCLREIGALPHCTPCIITDTKEAALAGGKYSTNPACTPEFIEKIDSLFHSKVFEWSVKFLDIDVKQLFCYAGKWSFGVNLGNGDMTKCHNVSLNYNFFENITEPIVYEEIGCECGIASCSLQYDMFSMGLIPSIENVPTYTELVCDRECLFTKKVQSMMNIKLYDNEHILTDKEEKLFLMKCIHSKNNEINTLKKAVSDLQTRNSVVRG